MVISTWILISILTFACLGLKSNRAPTRAQSDPIASFVVSNQAETIPGAHCRSNHLLFVEIYLRLTFHDNNQPLHKTRQPTKHLTKTIDRVPEVQGLLFAPCTVGPYGLPRRPPIYSQAPGPCLLFVMVNNSDSINERFNHSRHKGSKCRALTC